MIVLSTPAAYSFSVVVLRPSNQNIINRNMNKLNEKSHETHDEKTYASSAEDRSELLFVGFSALFYEVGTVFVEGY